jgi:glycosyltransferase involved in cell wall biosynthesis
VNQPADIIAFCKDWHEPKTSNNHILEELAKRHRVLWVNSITTRSPDFGSTNDLKKIWRKIRSWLAGVQVIHERLRVLTPVVLPFPRSRAAQRFNRCLTRALVRRTARRWGFRQPQLWIFPPNAVDYVGQFGESKVIYYCVDEWSQFTHLNTEFILQKERELLAKADAVFVVSQKLLAKHPGAHLIPHGVNFDLFAASGPIATELASLPHPIIGFYGNLYDWVDQELIATLATLRPHWSFVLVGKIMTDVSQLRLLNIHLPGPRRYEDLPSYCHGFDVGIIPYRMSDPRMQSVNPLKLREYLAAGLPVVSVNLPEARPLAKYVRFAATPDEFVQQIEATLAQDTPALRQQRSAAMRSESWSARAEQVERVLAERPAPQKGPV